jgi:hypothetical protein
MIGPNKLECFKVASIFTLTQSNTMEYLHHSKVTKKFIVNTVPGTVFTTPHFLCNLSLNVLKWKAFLLKRNLTRYLIGLILKLQRK